MLLPIIRMAILQENRVSPTLGQHGEWSAPLPGPLPPAHRPRRVLTVSVSQYTPRQDTVLGLVDVSMGHELLT